MENITRDYIEKLGYLGPYCFETDREEQCFNVGLKYGLEIADSNPAWISVEDDLPYNHEELIENEYLTKKVLVVLAMDEDPTKKHIEICDMCKFNAYWNWQYIAYYHVIYWKPLPELPKE